MTKDELDRMIRVDQAGEFGATRIYEGQLAVMGERGPHAQEIVHMAEQEKVHREKFDALMAERGVRPTALQPFWSAAGYALGAGTALLGPEAAMACTAAVEEEIDKHYSEQLDRLASQMEDDLAEVLSDPRLQSAQILLAVPVWMLFEVGLILCGIYIKEEDDELPAEDTAG